MSSRRDHLAAGALTGGIMATLCAARQNRKPEIGEVLEGVLGGMLGARLPDVFEPATHPNHRQFAHSVAFTATGARFAGRAALEFQQRCAMQARATSDPIARFLTQFAGGLGTGSVTGYVSHIAMDAGTPKGVPLLGL